MRMVPFLAGEERTGCSGTLLKGTVPCSLLSDALSRGWYSGDACGSVGREPSLLPGVSSAALSWTRMVPVLMPILEGPLQSSPMSCRAPDGACCRQPQGTCCLASLPGILHAGRNSRALARSHHGWSPPRQGAWGRGVRKPVAVFSQNILRLPAACSMMLQCQLCFHPLNKFV